ncbi:MAG TPA: 50S ribosomal protein L10 [Candidatus Peribacterales bacterium]|nr:50S ribosomal protein L10 [Candidatus Peribacterales bacterium]
MALTKAQKSAQLTDLREDMKKAKSLVWLQYRSLSVGDASALRRKIRAKNAKMKVAKKTLFSIAVKEEGMGEIAEGTLGTEPLAFIFSFEDEISGAKAAFEFSKTNDKVRLMGGLLNGKVLSEKEAVDLAKMLGREELLAQFAMMIRSPLTNFASLCSTPLRSFAIGVNQLAEKGGIPSSAS